MTSSSSSSSTSSRGSSSKDVIDRRTKKGDESADSERDLKRGKNQWKIEEGARGRGYSPLEHSSHWFSVFSKGGLLQYSSNGGSSLNGRVGGRLRERTRTHR